MLKALKSIAWGIIAGCLISSIISCLVDNIEPVYFALALAVLSFALLLACEIFTCIFGGKDRLK